MTARAAGALRLSAAERAALKLAAERYAAWQRDWHDDGAALNPVALADLRRAARAFRKALEPLLSGGGVNGTRSLLLARMQEAHLYQSSQSTYWDMLTTALHATIYIDAACARDVRRGVRADVLAHTWIRIAADAWLDATGKVPAPGRFAAALLGYRNKELPGVSGIDQVRAALLGWRSERQGNSTPQ